MGMPQLSEGKNRPCLEETVAALLESVALEGMAIGHLLNAQGESLQAVITGFRARELGFCELEIASKSTGKLLGDLIMKEWLLLSRFQSITDLAAALPGERCAPCPPKECPPTPALECSILPTLNPEICAACERRSRCKYHQAPTTGQL